MTNLNIENEHKKEGNQSWWSYHKFYTKSDKYIRLRAIYHTKTITSQRITIFIVSTLSKYFFYELNTLKNSESSLWILILGGILWWEDP